MKPLLRPLVLLTFYTQYTTAVNPYVSGCLSAKLPNRKIRVCNSEDTDDSVCLQPSFEYLEIRPYAYNWATAVFEAWIIQIVLSELLGVPATIETGDPNANLNFYDPEAKFVHGNGRGDIALANGQKYNADCTLASRDPDNYEPCTHIITEVWEVPHPLFDSLIEIDQILPPIPLHALGQEGWFMPKFTAEQHPELTSYLGLQGQREKLADLFPRPFTWKKYCENVSETKCAVPDGVAERAPTSEDEEQRMFVEGLYWGYFAKTDDNICESNPDCTGHIADYPCGWTSSIQGQAYHLDIALKSSGGQPNSGGYTAQQMREMWYAANSTRNNFMMIWWEPEALFQTFHGTDAEFIRVALPTPTLECMESRVKASGRCVDDEEIRLGSELGTCDEPPVHLHKVVLKAVQDRILSEGEDQRSPALDVLANFKITDLQLNELLATWKKSDDPREAVCQWVADNMDYMEGMVPPTYPRTIKVEEYSALFDGTLSLGCFVTACVLATAILVFRRRERQAIRLAQVEFLYLLLVGAFFVSLGAIVGSLPVSGLSCGFEVWFINLGFTLELVPLIVKVTAINRLVTAAQHLRRMEVKRKSLFASVAVISVLVMVFNALWVGIDPPQETSEYAMKKTVSDDGETIVQESYYCTSDADFWKYIPVGWNVFLLLVATVQAFQMQQAGVRDELNESYTLALMIYAHFVFVQLWAGSFFLSEVTHEAVVSRFRSIVFSLDTLATLLIYFVPKLLRENSRRSSSLLGQLQIGSRLFDDGNKQKSGPFKESASKSSTSDDTKALQDKVTTLQSEITKLAEENASLRQRINNCLTDEAAE